MRFRATVLTHLAYETVVLSSRALLYFTSLVLAGDIPVADFGFDIPPGVGLYKNEVWKRGRCTKGYPWQLYMPIAQPGFGSKTVRKRPGRW